MSDLHVWQNKGIALVVARSLEEAKSHMNKYYEDAGIPLAYRFEEVDYDFQVVPDSKVLRLHDDNGDVEEMQAIEFVRKYGPGLLMSTEY